VPLSESLVLVTPRIFDPSAFMTNTSAAPSGPKPGVRDVAIIVPSGENEDEA
jgi:hypothetical protein